MMAKKEFRRSRRRKVPEAIQVSDVMTEVSIGRLSNLSEGGLLLISNQTLVEDALYQFRFRLPGDNAEIEAGVHLLWMDQASTPGQTWAGYRFIAIADEDRERLRQWIDSPGGVYD